MKKRWITVLIAVVFTIGAAVPAQAYDEWMHLEPGVESITSSLLPGNKVTELYLQVGSASYDVYYEFKDQNGNYLIGGTLDAFQGTVIEFDRSTRPIWFPASFGPNVTGIQLTLTCSTSNGTCEAYANWSASLY